MTIILNGQKTEVKGRILTYDKIAAMAYEPTVTYSNGAPPKPEGILHAGQAVKLFDGMVIACIRTGNA